MWAAEVGEGGARSVWLGTCPGSGGLRKMTCRWKLWATHEITSKHSVALAPDFMILSQRSPGSLHKEVFALEEVLILTEPQFLQRENDS